MTIEPNIFYYVSPNYYNDFRNKGLNCTFEDKDSSDKTSFMVSVGFKVPSRDLIRADLALLWYVGVT